jgi:hypothetical protein
MSEQEVVAFMVNSVNKDNRELCDRAGMSQEEADSQIEKSQPSLNLLMTNLYSRMKEESLLA